MTIADIRLADEVRFRVQATYSGTDEVADYVFSGRLRELRTAEHCAPKTSSEIDLAYIETSPGNIIIPVLDIVEVVA